MVSLVIIYTSWLIISVISSCFLLSPVDVYDYFFILRDRSC